MQVQAIYNAPAAVRAVVYLRGLDQFNARAGDGALPEIQVLFFRRLRAELEAALGNFQRSSAGWSESVEDFESLHGIGLGLQPMRILDGAGRQRGLLAHISEMRGNEGPFRGHDIPGIYCGQIARPHGEYSGSSKAESSGFMASPDADISMDEKEIAGLFFAYVVRIKAGKAAFRALAEDVFHAFRLGRFSSRNLYGRGDLEDFTT